MNTNGTHHYNFRTLISGACPACQGEVEETDVQISDGSDLEEDVYHNTTVETNYTCKSCENTFLSVIEIGDHNVTAEEE